ncbi:ATP-dependent nuclease [Pollutibacter soli]|uniref:ATP-dependent nuclease n=1 Tax=Pollutibacter soli TaxID=3034157 RepID=UPI003013F317
MILDCSVKIKNYKCFGSEAQGLERIFPLNIIIGKNNSGKSSLIDLIEYITSPTEKFIEIGRDRIKSEISIQIPISKEMIDSSFPIDTSGGGIPGANHNAYGQTFVGKKIQYTLLPKKKTITSWEQEPHPTAEVYVRRLENNIIGPLENKFFIRLSAERDIRPEGDNPTKNTLAANGDGATNMIRQVVTHAEHDLNLIRKDLLSALNEILNPEIVFTNIAPRRTSSNGMWEIYLEDNKSNLISLSRMGSGIKTILLVLLNMLVVPKIESKIESNLVFGFEELENNLHPSLQRRLFNFIFKYSLLSKSYFFITTHSSIIIDLFSNNKNAQIIHTQNDGMVSSTKALLSLVDGKNILRDLEYKSSDLLLSNGIIWVEGPSDVIYIELLFKLFIKSNPETQLERFNYTIQSLSTAIWKYAGFSDLDWNKLDEGIANKIVSLEKVNSNHLLIIDQDSNYQDIPPESWNQQTNGIGKIKARLVYESMMASGQDPKQLINNFGETVDSMLFWITDGTIESYLEYFINKKGKENFAKYFDSKKSRGYFEKKRAGKDNSISKVQLAIEISKFCLEKNLTFSDLAPQGSNLYNKINKLLNKISTWN